LTSSSLTATAVAAHVKDSSNLGLGTAKEQTRKRYITSLLGLSYLGVIVAVMALPCALSLIDKGLFSPGPSGTTVALPLSHVIFTASLATMGGKFLLGPPTDTLGGHAVLMLSLAINAVGLSLLSCTTSQISFAIGWTLVSFLYGATWGAVGAVVRREFPKDEWSSQLGLAAAFSRLGSLGSSIAFGHVIKSTGGSWRAVFRVAAALQVYSSNTMSV
jgi:MFS family permease